MKTTQGPELVLVVLGVALFAPLVEELLFRGLLLRSLLRRTTAGRGGRDLVGGLRRPSTCWTRAPSPLMAPLLLLAVISGIRAVRTGDLSQSILLHVGLQPALRDPARRPPDDAGL